MVSGKDINSVNSEKFQIFPFSTRNYHIWVTIAKMITRKYSRIFTNSSFIWFTKFCKEINLQGEFVKIREFFLMFFLTLDVFPQKWQFRLENKILKFLGIQPSYGEKSELMWCTVFFVYPNGPKFLNINIYCLIDFSLLVY